MRVTLSTPSADVREQLLARVPASLVAGGRNAGGGGDAPSFSTWSVAAAALLTAERAAIGRELHDGPSQGVTAAAFRLQSALLFDELTPDVAATCAAELEAAGRQLRQVLDRVAGGVPAEVVAATLERAAAEAGLAATVDPPVDGQVAPAVATALAAAAAAAASALAACGAATVRIALETTDQGHRALLTPDAGELVIVTAVAST